MAYNILQKDFIIYGYIDGKYDNTPQLLKIYNPNWVNGETDEFFAEDGTRWFNSKIEKQFDNYLRKTKGANDVVGRKIVELRNMRQ